MKRGALRNVEKALVRARGKTGAYSVPSLWTGKAGRTAAVKVDPASFYLTAVRRILKAPLKKRKGGAGGEWTREAVVYNMFVRTTTAFDHDQDGVIALPLNSSGMRETGTFLKSIAILPYLRNIGVNTLHLLPITAIGRDGNKGTLGSPYAIRNPYEIDERQSEPFLGLDVKTEFTALVEAAHRLGLRVVVEFVFRTAAKDSDWIREHPEWFYWIREEIESRPPGSTDETKFGSPIFTSDELERIRQSVAARQMDALTPPHQVYQDFFRQPPSRETVRMDGGSYTGVSPDGSRVKIPGAFADWPPDDNQPPWDDVTYLKMYNHPGYNYMAYNTIRMYDARMRHDEANTGLWEKIAGIIPFYQREFGIDGVMIDMGHALPQELKSRMIRTAREIDPQFAFWDEDFSIGQKNRDEGYNAVVGYLWMDEHHPSRMREFFRRCAGAGMPIPFFAGAETHNTPRAASRNGGEAFSRWSWVINCFLPGVPFLHSGLELGEMLPINTGLDFTADQLEALPAERLPLFSEHAYDWTKRRNLVPFFSKVCAIRSKFASLVTDPDPATFHHLDDENQAILAFERSGPGGRRRLLIIVNSNCFDKERCTLSVNNSGRTVTDLLSGMRIPIRGGILRKTLKPGESLVVQV